MIALAAMGCGAQTSTDAAAPPDAPRPAASLDARMHAHFDAVRRIHGALLSDDLDAAREGARELARMEATGELGRWQEPVQFVRAQARRIAAADSAAEARPLAAGLATVCADCHMVYARDATFRAAPMPALDGTVHGVMVRHQWAADTMWLGVIAPSTELWRTGLAAITDVPVTAELAPDRRSRLQMEALRHRLVGLKHRPGEIMAGQGDRAARLAEILEVCASCHAIARP